MIDKKWWLGLSLIGLLASGGMWWHRSQQAIAPAASAPTQGGSAWFTAQTPGAPNGPTTSASGQQAPAASPLDSMIPPVFRANRDGTLLFDPQTRVDVERVQALYPRDEALTRLASLSEHLPNQARQQLKGLFQQYAQYNQAVAQAFTPDAQTSPSMDEALRQLDSLHALRQQYFGEDGAQAMFGDEERTARELIELMRNETDPKLPMEERAERAQEAWQKRHPPQP